MTTYRQLKKNAKRLKEEKEIQRLTEIYVEMVINEVVDSEFEKMFGFNPTDMLTHLVRLQDERRRMEEVGE